MTVQTELSDHFEKELRRLHRKFPSILSEVEILVDQLERGELPGDKIPNIGYNVYKVRLRNPSAGRGKRGGFRAIYYVRHTSFVVLITIYFKSDQTDIHKERLQALIQQYKASQRGSADPNKNRE